MKVWERVLGATPARSASVSSFDDYVDLISYLGNNYPFVHNTMGNLTEEQIVTTVDQAVKRNGPVFALMLARLQVFSQIRFQWTRFERGKPTDLFGSPELALLENPWPGGVTADLLARMEIHVTRAGNAFVRRGAGRLHVLRPEWMTVMMGSQYDADHPAEAPDVDLLGYLYKPPNGKLDVFEPHEIAHYAPIPDPDSVFLGMSWITPVLTDVMGDDAALVHKRKFFQNAATPNLAIKFDPTVTIDQVKEFKALLEEEHRGAWNAYKTLYLGGGADPVTIGKDFAQMEFAVTQGKGESRLASAAGVPPSWVGFSEGLQGSALNAGNFGAARRRFGDGTMQHLWGNACSSLSTIIRPPTGSNVAGATLWFSAAGVPFLREDSKDAAEIQGREAQTIAALVREGWTPESVVAAVQNADWSLLKHTGLLSVQLQPPGQSTQPAPAAPQEGNNDA
jgi:phage portal protein BeeE